MKCEERITHHVSRFTHPKKMAYYLGLDGGGTKTAAVILDADHVERGRGQGGPCNIATCDDATLAASVCAATEEARCIAGLPADTRFAGVCAGVAGYTAKRRRADFARLLAETVPADRHRVEPDFVIAYWGATEGEPGLVVIAGTGAVVYGRSAAGETCRVDGRGFLLGDRGSGFDIGRFALRQTLRQLDSGEPLDEFGCRVPSAIGAEDTDDLIEWVYRDFQPAKIAGLAAQIGEWAAEGNETAAVYVRQAAHALRSAVAKTRRRLQMPVSTPIYTLGGLWQTGDLLRITFQNGSPALIQKPPQVSICPPKHDPAYGAALQAMQEVELDGLKKEGNAALLRDGDW